MILVDSSVWIDFFNGVPTQQAELLDRALRDDDVLAGDLIVAEVLQGFADAETHNKAERMFRGLENVEISGIDIGYLASRNYRTLRSLGITVRKTIDTLIATRCILNGYTLLHRDRDFDGFERHLGLQIVPSPAAS